MKKKNAKQKGDSPPQNPEADAASEPREDYELKLAWCQRILRALTVAIMASFLLIIALTTASTGPFVQVTAKALYHLILLSALISLATWTLRVRLEKKVSQGVDPGAEVLKET